MQKTSPEENHLGNYLWQLEEEQKKGSLYFCVCDGCQERSQKKEKNNLSPAVNDLSLASSLVAE